MKRVRKNGKSETLERVQQQESVTLRKCNMKKVQHEERATRKKKSDMNRAQHENSAT